MWHMLLTMVTDQTGKVPSFPKKEHTHSMSLLWPRKVSFPGGSYHMDTGAKLGEVWGKQPVADEICDFLLLSVVLFKQNQSCK